MSNRQVWCKPSKNEGLRNQQFNGYAKVECKLRIKQINERQLHVKEEAFEDDWISETCKFQKKFRNIN